MEENQSKYLVTERASDENISIPKKVKDGCEVLVRVDLETVFELFVSVAELFDCNWLVD